MVSESGSICIFRSIVGRGGGRMYSVGFDYAVTVPDLVSETKRSFEQIRRLTKSRHRIIQRLGNLDLIKLDKIMDILS
jgi:hypothetical protein